MAIRTAAWLVVVATLAMPRPGAAAPSLADQVAAATGELTGVELRGLATPDLRAIAVTARDRGVTLAWPQGLDDETLVGRLDDSGLLAAVTSASVDCDACVRRLARARHATALRTLSVSGCAADGMAYWHSPCVWLGRAAANALAATRGLPALTDLRVVARTPVLRTLVRGRLARSLRALTVTTDASGMAVLGRAPTLARLERLVVEAPEGTARSVSALVSSRFLRALDTLVFLSSDSEAYQTLGRGGMVALARSMKLRAVRTLDLAWNYQGGQLAALVSAPWLTQLERLDVVHTGLTDAGVDALALLAARGPWPALTMLALDETGDDGQPRFAPLAAFSAVLVGQDHWESQVGRPSSSY
ncbi:MAG: hypothetical protein IPL61_37090 [Myxococcales bacterium]|nr:hypothetical protein [Myxococcales bacterium]